MEKVRGKWLWVALSMMILRANAAGAVLIVDSFDEFQLVEAPPASSVSDETSGIGILGSERDVFATAGPGFGSTLVVVNEFGNGLFGYEQGWDKGAAIVIWDGSDASILLDPVGLGGIDLTESGVADALGIDVAFIDSDVTLEFTIYTDGANFSESSIFLTSASSIGVHAVAFSAFTAVGGTGVDFENVGAIQMSIQGLMGTDFQAAQLATTQFAPIPEPETFLLTALGIVVMLMNRPEPVHA